MDNKTFSINCDELKKKVRNIRASHLPAEDVIEAILKASANYDASEAEKVPNRIKQQLGNDEDRIERYSEALRMEVQVMANLNGAWLMDDLTRIAREFAVFDSYPFARRCWFGMSEDIDDDHNQWMEYVYYEPTKERLNYRIENLLVDLMNSDFLSLEYAEKAGISPKEIKDAHQELTDLEFHKLLEIKDADVKYALLTKYIGEPVKSGEIAPPSRVRWYMSEAHISNEAALAYFRFVALVQKAYEELDRLQNEHETNHDKLSPEEKAVDEFVDKLNRLVDNCYDKHNGKMCSQGGRKLDAKIQIKRDELKAHIKNERENNYETLEDIVSSGAKTNQKQFKYIGGLRNAGYFGKLTKKGLGIVAATIFGRSATYIEKNL